MGIDVRDRQDQRALVAVAKRIIVWTLALVTGWLVLRAVFDATSGFLFLILLSWICSMAMEPAVRRLVARGWKRSAAVGTVGVAAIVVIVLLLAVFGGVFFSQLSDLLASVPSVLDSAVTWVNGRFHTNLSVENITQSLGLSTSDITGMASTLAGGVLSVVASVAGFVVQLFTVVIFTFYLGIYGPTLIATIGSWLPASAESVLQNVTAIATNKTGGYVASKLALIAISATFHGIFFLILGIPYWLPLSLLVGVVGQLIPVVGTYVGIVIPVLFVVFTEPLDALWIVAFATLYQQFENYLLMPWVSKRTMDVNSGIALASVFIGEALWGPVGALIGIPLAACAVAVVQTYVKTRDERAAETEADTPAPLGGPPGGAPSGAPATEPA